MALFFPSLANLWPKEKSRACVQNLFINYLHTAPLRYTGNLPGLNRTDQVYKETLRWIWKLSDVTETYHTPNTNLDVIRINQEL